MIVVLCDLDDGAALWLHARFRERGRSSTRMRGEPRSSFTRRTSVSGRKVRPRLQKRGAKSVTSIAWPRRS